MFMDAGSNKTIEPRAGKSPGLAALRSTKSCPLLTGWAGGCSGTLFCVSSNSGITQHFVFRLIA